MNTTKGQLNVRIPLHLIEWIKKSAQSDQRSLNNYVAVTFEKLKQLETTSVDETIQSEKEENDK